jgi:tetratricopeptide (TPR) repeat protein
MITAPETVGLKLLARSDCHAAASCIRVRHFSLALFVWWLLCQFACAAADISPLRSSLAAAEKAEDQPAIIELSRRLVDANSHDSAAWEKLARALFAQKDYARCNATLDTWEKASKPPAAAIEELRGDVGFAQKDTKGAERHWLAFIARKPAATDAAATLDSLADLCVDQSRWRENAEFRKRAVAAEVTAARRVALATALLRLRQWDAALKEMQRANALDAGDTQVTEWLPQFERLQKFLPRIKGLDAQVSKMPTNAALLLDRARLLTLAERPLLALDDCQQALKLQPNSLRARVQTAEALQDSERGAEAAKLGVSHDLARTDGNHVSEKALRDLAAKDLLVAQNPGRPEPLAARSKALRDLRQFTLALADAQAALAIDANSAAGHFEAAHDLDGLGRTKEALVHIRRAVELNPNDAVAWYYRGVIEAHRADFAAAIESQTRSLAIHESAVALREREKCARRLGSVAQADADLRRVQELEPTKP